MRRVVIAEDQAIAREALRVVLEREGYDVAGEAAEGLEAMRLLRTHRPDLLVLGLRLRRLNGIEVIRRAHRAFPTLRMLVLSEIDNAMSISECEKAGASGFVSKTGDFAEFVLALKAIERGRRWFPADETRHVESGCADAQDTSPIGVLSQRELSVLRYLAEGFRIRDIASEMALNERTISTYKARLLRKLNVHSVVGLVDIARRFRLASQAELPPGGVSDATGDIPAPSPYPEIHALLDTLPFGVSVRTLDGHVVFANRHVHSRLGPQRFEAFRRVGLREQALLFGVDEPTARRLEAAFVDATARAVAYRLDAVAESGGELSIGVHWGAPLADANGTVTLMIGGNFNVNGAERLMIGLHEAMAEALSASEARAALLDTRGGDVSAPLDEAIALLGEASARRGAATNDPIAQAHARLQLAALRFDHLRLLATANETAHAWEAHRCDLRQVTRHVVRRSQEGMAMLNVRFLTNFSGRGSGAVWLDSARYARLLAALLYRAAVKDSTGEIPVALQATLRGGGLVDIELRIGPDRAPRKEARRRQTEGDARAEQIELVLCRKMAQALRGELETGGGRGAAAVVLKLSLPRGSEIA